MLTILDFDLVTSRSHWHGITRSITHYLCPEQRKLPKTKELSRIVHHHKKTLYKVFRNCPTRWPYSGKILAVLPVSLWRTGPSCTRTTLWSGNTWIEYFNILLLFQYTSIISDDNKATRCDERMVRLGYNVNLTSKQNSIRIFCYQFSFYVPSIQLLLL